MNKTAIKNFAIWARNKLIADITYKAGLLGITEKKIKSPLPQSTKDVQFFDIGTKEPYSISGIEIKQREALVTVIRNKEQQADYSTAYKAVIEEVGYTWFNRLIAVRFMEVNDYLPSRIRVLSSESAGKNEPDLVTNPFDTDLEFTPYEEDRIMQLKQENQLDELFRMLVIKQCNALNAILPNLFEKTSDYTELLLNVAFTDKDGVVYHLVHDIPEDDFNVSKEGQVEIIGWLYQYYNTEPKDETFALLKKNVKITKERIPAATQLFTPDWIVRYMVENSLGRLWLEGHPNNTLKSEWKYYLDEAEQEEEVQKQLDAIREEYKSIKPENIKVIDPCMGSGHILVYAFEVLMQIYESYGYSQRDAAKSIIENNIYGLDIDNRAYQLAYFAIMMKARQYNRRILSGETKPHVYAIQESNSINRDQLKYFGAGMDEMQRNIALLQIQGLLDAFVDAKEYGSLLNVDDYDWELLNKYMNNIGMTGQLSFDTVGIEDTQNQLRLLVKIGAVMTQKYDVVVTNPPYMGLRGMSGVLASFVQRCYPNSKTDLYSAFIEKCYDFSKQYGKVSMVTMHSWMFLTSFEQLRIKILGNCCFDNLVHLGMEAFEGIVGKVVSTVAFIYTNVKCHNYKMTAIKLTELYDGKKHLKETEFFNMKNRFSFNKQSNYQLIPGMPIAYWITERMINNFSKGISIEQISDFTGSQNITADNEKFLRFFWEINQSDVLSMNWVFYAKGGSYRKWYGNIDLVVDWRETARHFYQTNPTSNLLNERYWYKKGITYTELTNLGNSFRLLPEGMVFDKKGPSIVNVEHLYYCLALLNSNLANEYFQILNPSLSTQVRDVKNFPIIIANQETINHVKAMAEDCIKISKEDWDSFEVSWNFVKHPFLNIDGRSMESIYSKWTKCLQYQRTCLKENEKKLNEIFNSLYDVSKEIPSDVEEKYVVLRSSDLHYDILSFISYVVGCMFGRYSLDAEGLVYAGGQWDDGKYNTFIPDKDNILPITDEEYFEDDIVGLFVAFVKKVYGVETLEENLDFIAKALGNKGNTSREIIRNYFVKDFFKDHCKVYQKRPIYWLFESGKADGFKALIYMHRYDENTIGNLRIDYLHKMQRIYEREIVRMQETIDNSTNTREVAAAEKRKDKLIKQLKETKDYDEKIAHLALARIAIDLDDGVKVNYEKVQTGTDGKKLEVLAKI